MNPVHYFKGKWYFYDETWSERSIPFDTKEEAMKAFSNYCEEYLKEGGEND